MELMLGHSLDRHVVLVVFLFVTAPPVLGGVVTPAAEPRPSDRAEKFPIGNDHVQSSPTSPRPHVCKAINVQECEECICSIRASYCELVACADAQLQRIPRFDRNVTYEKITLYSNSISTIKTDSFSPGLRVSELNLDGNRLRQLEGSSFRNVSGLKWLSLRDNRLASIWKESLLGLRELTKLSLNDNQIRMIQDRAFVELARLQHMYLDNNRLERLTSQLLTGLKQLVVLSLAGNKISCIEAGSFADLSQVRYLSLENNKINTLSGSALNGLSGVGTLWLEDNNISEIATGTFANLSVLYTLNLKNNRLKHIDQCAFAGQKGILYLWLQGNPINCDCDLGWYRHWIHTIHHYVDSPQCQTPEEFRGHSPITFPTNNCTDPPANGSQRCTAALHTRSCTSPSLQPTRASESKVISAAHSLPSKPIVRQCKPDADLPLGILLLLIVQAVVIAALVVMVVILKWPIKKPAEEDSPHFAYSQMCSDETL